MARKQAEQSTTCYRHELEHGDGADFIAYQRHVDGVWQTLSTWMIPRAVCK